MKSCCDVCVAVVVIHSVTLHMKSKCTHDSLTMVGSLGCLFDFVSLVFSVLFLCS